MERDYFQEALAIAERRTMLLPEREHIKALLDKIRGLKVAVDQLSDESMDRNYEIGRLKVIFDKRGIEY